MTWFMLLLIVLTVICLLGTWALLKMGAIADELLEGLEKVHSKENRDEK